MILQSGAIDTPGNIYVFNKDCAFFMSKNGYKDDFIDEFLSIVGEKKLENNKYVLL